MSFARAPLFMVIALVALVVSSCDQNPTGPGTSSGNLLTASIDGSSYTFTLAEQRYDSVIQYSFVSGISGSGTATKTLTITFTSDIQSGSYPRTLSPSDVSIILIDRSSGQNVSYDCISHPDRCSITLTKSDGMIVDGTFFGRLTSQSDATKEVNITNGTFSVKLR